VSPDNPLQGQEEVRKKLGREWEEMDPGRYMFLTAKEVVESQFIPLGLSFLQCPHLKDPFWTLNIYIQHVLIKRELDYQTMNTLGYLLCAWPFAILYRINE
jgi:hypothetical protein